MAILQAILTMILQQAGRLLNTLFGWATSLLFGQVPEKRQLYLSLMGLGAVAWIVVVLGIAFPSFAAFLLAFVPLPEWINPNWIRLTMLGLALLLPAAVGGLSLLLADPPDRPKGTWETFRAVLKGYPFTVGLALTLVLMIVVAPILKVRDLLHGWTSTHVPVVIASRDYPEIVKEVQRILSRGGIETRQEQASWLLRGPTRIFTFFAGGSHANLVAEELTVLKAVGLEVLLHPSDLVIRGKEREVTRAHSLITEHLTFTKCYLTWTREGHQFEDRLVALWHKAWVDSQSEEPLNELKGIEEDLKTIPLSYEEWEVLFREKLLVERALLRQRSRLSSVSQRAGELQTSGV